jgi:hypothetical protein
MQVPLGDVVFIQLACPPPLECHPFLPTSGVTNLSLYISLQTFVPIKQSHMCSFPFNLVTVAKEFFSFTITDVLRQQPKGNL